MKIRLSLFRTQTPSLVCNNNKRHQQRHRQQHWFLCDGSTVPQQRALFYTKAVSSARGQHLSLSQSIKEKDNVLRLHDFLPPRTALAQPSMLPQNNAINSHQQQHQQQRDDDSTVTLFHIKTYGCQMNVNDSDIVRRLLFEAGLREVTDEANAHVILTNTCAIREGAEQKVWHRLQELRAKCRPTKKGRMQKKRIVGVLGCMAERLKEDLLQDGMADLVVGPDAYRDLPRLIKMLLDEEHQQEVELAINVQLSLDETYADITPIRRNPDDVSAFVSIQRGCANRCSFCIVPFTRGQERSRPQESIVREIEKLHFEDGVMEVTLLGQNVNSYHDQSPSAIQARPETNYNLSNDGFRSRIRRASASGYWFADLLAAVSDISPELRVRFTSPHPKDYPPELLSLMAERSNICKHLHMPAQSGSSTVLHRMKRGYTREAYLRLVDDVCGQIPDVALSSDFIAGFCDESEEEHQDTITLMEQVQYDQAYMFAYSMRDKTNAQRTMQDNVPEHVKQQRLREMIDTFQKHVQIKNERTEVGRLRLVLVEGEAKRNPQPGIPRLTGRTDQNKRIFFPGRDGRGCFDDASLQPLINNVIRGRGEQASSFLGLPPSFNASSEGHVQPGDYAVVEVTEAKGHTLRGRLLWRSSILDFEQSGLSHCDSTSRENAARSHSS